MKIILISFLVFPLLALSQDSKKNADDPGRLKEKKINLSAARIAPAEVKLPFSRIKIIDERFDTTKLGFTQTGSIFQPKINSFRKLTLKNGIASSIQNYYTDYYQNSFSDNGFELLIVLKKFWISPLGANKNKGIDVAAVSTDDPSLSCKWEYYLGKNEEYLPVKRIDTIFELSLETITAIEQEFDEPDFSYLKFYLKGLVERYDFNKAIEVFEKQPKRTFSQIQAYNKARFNIPVLQDSSLKKGVYLSFKEFCENKPSLVQFKEKAMRYGNLKKENFIETEDGNAINDYWGYYTGKEFRYGRYGNDRMYRNENTYEFFGKITIVVTNRSANPPLPPIPTKNTQVIWIPFQLDMETGEVY